MRKLKIIVLAMASLLSLGTSTSADIAVMSLQERMRRSDAVVVGTIEEVRQTDAGVAGQFPPPVTHWIATCRVEHYIIGPKINNPAVEEGKAVSLIRIAFVHIPNQKPSPLKLVAGKKYLLFLKETGPNEYEMITPHHGAFEEGDQDYFIHDEQSPEYPKAVKISFEEIVHRVTPKKPAPELSQALTLSIKSDKKSYEIGEDITLDLEFKNTGPQNLWLFTRMLPQLELTIRLYKMNGNEKEDITPPVLIDMLRQFAADSDFTEILPGQIFSKRVGLRDFSPDITLPKGNYVVSVVLNLPPDLFSRVTIIPWTGKMQSNMIGFEVNGEKLSMKGSLTFPDGTRPVGATITLGNENSHYQATSDKNGHYAFYDIPPGQYNLMAFGVGADKEAGMFIEKDIRVEAEGPALEVPVVLGPPQQ